MKKIKVFNNCLIERAFNLSHYESKINGFSTLWFKQIQSRLEISSKKDFLLLDFSKWLIFSSLLTSSLPKTLSVEKKSILNIFILDILGTYKGWRHLKGLPVRGQRTWTNGWSAYRSNLILRKFKLKITKKMYGKLPLNEINTAYLAEQINLLWKVQWELEWKDAKKQRLKAIRKGNKTKIDVSNMAKGQIVSPEKLKKMNKKQRQSIKKNTYSLGFDLGFTKKIVDQLYSSNQSNSAKKGSKTTSVFSNEEKKTKKQRRKKVDLKAKKIKHAIKKKSKKSVWD